MGFYYDIIFRQDEHRVTFDPVIHMIPSELINYMEGDGDIFRVYVESVKECVEVKPYEVDVSDLLAKFPSWEQVKESLKKRYDAKYTDLIFVDWTEDKHKQFRKLFEWLVVFQFNAILSYSD
jgi:hypothetical protein